MFTIKIEIKDTLNDYSLKLEEELTDNEANMTNPSKLREVLYDLIKKAPTGE